MLTNIAKSTGDIGFVWGIRREISGGRPRKPRPRRMGIRTSGHDTRRAEERSRMNRAADIESDGRSGLEHGFESDLEAMGNVCTGNGDQEQRKTEAMVFKWRIEGFSSLSTLPDATCVSRPFKFGGYSWNLKIKPKNIDIKSGKECMGLVLQLENASSLPLDLVLNTAFELCVYDQLHNCPRMFPANFYFRYQHGAYGFQNFIPLDVLKYFAYGFLVNDACNVSVKFVKFNAQKVDRSNLFECLSLQEKPAAQGFTWKIENFTKLPRPEATSHNFVAGGHKWNIRVYPEGKKSSDYLGIFLKLHTTPALPFESEVFAEFSLSLLDQINGKHKKFTVKHRFSKAASSSDLIELLPIEDFQDPLNGFLVENACIIEASVMVLGSSTGTDGLLI